MADTDAIIVKEAGNAVATIEMHYKMADINGKAALKDEKQKAWDNYLKARTKLLADGVISTDADLAEMVKIRSDIETAADRQKIIEGAVKLAKFLAKFLV